MSGVAGGIALLAAALAAMLFANSALAPSYAMLIEMRAGLTLGETAFSKPLLAWINEGLMTVFFFTVGLSLKREALEGALAQRSQLLLPAAAALGGMAVPAAIYWAFNRHDAVALAGWAIPAATDIAFAAGVLALLGSRVPHGLKVFVLTLAVLDDLGAILIIALFYSGGLAAQSLAVGACALAVLWVLNRRGVVAVSPYLLVGLVLWAAVLNSGVHATLAGVLLALFIPLRDGKGGELIVRLERDLHLPVTYAILPAFAFMNAGVPLAGLDAATLTQPVTMGVALGLLAGKCIGVLTGSWCAVRAGAALPQGVRWPHMAGASLVCGIGFTMSLFLASLAFESGPPELAIQSRVGILAGSLLSGLAGYWLLRVVANQSSERRIGAGVAAQQIAQHSAAGERVLQVQLVDAAHERQVGLRGGLRPVVHPRARHVEQLYLTHDRQPDEWDRSSLCARIADATERAGQKLYLQRLLADLGVQCLQIGAGVALLCRRREHLGGALEQLRSPLPDLVGMDLELLSELDQGPIAADRGQRHFRLERR